VQQTVDTRPAIARHAVSDACKHHDGIVDQ
jgi:hypothetical protein